MDLAGKAHTSKRAAKKVTQMIVEDAKNYPAGGTVQIFHADNLDGAETMATQLREVLPDNFDVTIEWLSPVIGVHVGRNTVGFSMLPDMANYEK